MAQVMQIDEMRVVVRQGIELIDAQAQLIKDHKAYIVRLEGQVDALKRELGEHKLLADLLKDVIEKLEQAPLGQKQAG